MMILVLACMFSQITELNGLSLESTFLPKQFIDIVNPLGRSQERLPASLIQQWPTWTWSLQDSSWCRIKSDNDPGLVNPFSIDYLWQPVDLNPPDCTLALAIHCRNGVPRHILPAIDVSFGADNLHHNRGLHTSPRAWKWFDFSSYVAGTRKCRLELRTIDPAASDGNIPVVLQTFEHVNTLVDRMLLAISEDPPNEVRDGSVIVQTMTSFPTRFKLPRQNHFLAAVLIEDDDSLIGSLDVMVQATSAGSQSLHLPEAYSRLFQDEMRPEYGKFQQRKAEREQ
jgi:hypothetical protein